MSICRKTITVASTTFLCLSLHQKFVEKINIRSNRKIVNIFPRVLHCTSYGRADEIINEIVYFEVDCSKVFFYN